MAPPRGNLATVRRLVDIDQHIDLLAERITFIRQRARELIGEVISRICCPGGNCTPDSKLSLPILDGDALDGDIASYRNAPYRN